MGIERIVALQFGSLKKEVSNLEGGATSDFLKYVELSADAFSALPIKEAGVLYAITDDEEETPTYNLYATQLIPNSTFDSASGCIGSNATISASGNVLFVEGTGGNASVRVRQEDIDLTASAGDVIFMSAKVRANNNAAQSIYLVLKDGSIDLIANGDGSISSPVMNQWYELYFKFTLQYDDVTRAQIYTQYATSAAADGSITEVEGLKDNDGEFICYNLTKFDADNGTDLASMDASTLHALQYQGA